MVCGYNQSDFELIEKILKGQIMDLIFLNKKDNQKIVIDTDGNEISDIGKIFEISRPEKKYNTFFINQQNKSILFF